MFTRFTRISAGLTTLAAAAALAVVPTGAGAAADSPRRPGTTSLAEVLAADGNRFDHNWQDFDIVDRAVHTVLRAKPDSAVGVLAKGRTRLTAFVPNDRAFRRLVRSLTGDLPGTEKGTFRAVASVADVDTLEAILLYHVVPGATITSADAAGADGAALTTAQGGNLRVDVRRSGIFLRDKDPNARNPQVIVVDINKGNKQIAHGINRVLRPINL
jgi:uncharacterized surface protein with fasciclin (FAS1) repeats